MKVLGCTGGIGSGKSYVANIFGKMGIPLYDSDYRAKFLYDSDRQLRSQMIALLGEGIVKDGIIQRGVIASMIFNDKNLLTEVEALVHPAVMRDFCRWKESLKNESNYCNAPFVIMESAILLEKPAVRACAHKVLTVLAPLELRIERVMARDNVTRKQVLERMSAQWSDNERAENADFIIFADGKRALLPQIRSVYDAMGML